MKLLGFTGIMGSGKSTAINLLEGMVDAPVINVKFAQPLYDMQEYAYNRIKSVYTRPETFIKDRKLLQWLGTDWGRSTIGNNVWVDLWAATVKERLAMAPNALIVCDDVRFDNEATAVKALGGHVVQLRVNASRAEAKAGIANHASENGVDTNLLSAIIDNTGSIDDLKASLQMLNKTLGIW